jgi:hypothetical protein
MTAVKSAAEASRALRYTADSGHSPNVVYNTVRDLLLCLVSKGQASGTRQGLQLSYTVSLLNVFIIYFW